MLSVSPLADLTRRQQRVTSNTSSGSNAHKPPRPGGELSAGAEHLERSTSDRLSPTGLVPRGRARRRSALLCINLHVAPVSESEIPSELIAMSPVRASDEDEGEYSAHLMTTSFQGSSWNAWVTSGPMGWRGKFRVFLMDPPCLSAFRATVCVQTGRRADF